MIERFRLVGPVWSRSVGIGISGLEFKQFVHSWQKRDSLSFSLMKKKQKIKTWDFRRSK